MIAAMSDSGLYLQLHGEARTPGGRGIAWSRMRSVGRACGRSWQVCLLALSFGGRQGCGLAATDGWRESDRAEMAGTSARQGGPGGPVGGRSWSGLHAGLELRGAWRMQLKNRVWFIVG